MISQSTIDAVRAKADLEEIVNRYTTVKTHKACCPFHDEKSPSFHIRHNEFYKCFGCGASGDVFRFVMEKENKPFDEAVQWLADHYNIPVEHDRITREQSQEQIDRRTQASKILQWALTQYQKQLAQLPDDAAAVRYLLERGISRDDQRYRGYGYAPDSFDFLKTTLINGGHYEIGKEVGLLGTKEGRNYDFYRRRIIIPINDQNGRLVGIAGRHVPMPGDDPQNKPAKYFNPRDNILYQKKKVLYGLDKAQRAIKEAGFVYLTEGYFDVDTMQAHDIYNVVASCGTEFDEDQIRFLKRYTPSAHVVLCYDGDTAGLTKMEKLVDKFLAADFKVEVIILPDKQDPDEYLRAYQPEEYDDSLVE